jgi:hypothetical protein
MVEAILKQGFGPTRFPPTGVRTAPPPESWTSPTACRSISATACPSVRPLPALLRTPRVFPVFKNRGTFKVGSPADIALLELREGTFEYVDNYTNKITGRQRLFPAGTVLAGKRIQRP